MPDDLLSTPTMLGFLLTLVRISGVFVFVPVPGLKSAMDAARIVLVIAITIAMFPVWPRPNFLPSAGNIAAAIASEAALGIGIGLALAFVIESFLVGAQIISLQAGYSFASTVDPNSQADSTVLAMLAQTVAALLFFTTGLDRELLRVLAHSLETLPAGTFLLSTGNAHSILTIGSLMFSSGLRLALPIMAILVMTDISLALLGRINSQLQLLTLAMPIKMVLGLATLSWIAVLMPALLRGGIGTAFSAIHGFLVR